MKKGVAKDLKKAKMKKSLNQIGRLGQCSVGADENKILIITITNTMPALTAHFDFSPFPSRPFLSSWPLLFYTQGVFGLDFISFLFIYNYNNIDT